MDLTMLSFYHEVTLYKVQKPQSIQYHLCNKGVNKVYTTLTQYRSPLLKYNKE